MRAIDGDALKDRLQNLAYDDWNQGVSTTWANAYSECADIVEQMPTIEERKKGKWIYYDIENDKYDEVRCSECGKTFTVDAERWYDIGFTASDLKFCPNCGADMRGEKE